MVATLSGPVCQRVQCHRCVSEHSYTVLYGLYKPPAIIQFIRINHLGEPPLPPHRTHVTLLSSTHPSATRPPRDRPARLDQTASQVRWQAQFLLPSSLFVAPSASPPSHAHPLPPRCARSPAQPSANDAPPAPSGAGGSCDDSARVFFSTTPGCRRQPDERCRPCPLESPLNWVPVR